MSFVFLLGSDSNFDDLLEELNWDGELRRETRIDVNGLPEGEIPEMHSSMA